MNTNTGKTILVIDDESAIRDYLRFVLEREGYVVIEADNGRSGMDVFLTSKIDLVISDLVMPDTEGVETIAALKKKSPHTPIIAMSGALNGDTYLRMVEGLGADASLQKPFDHQKVMSALGRLLGGAPAVRAGLPG